MAAPSSYSRRSFVGNAAATTVPLGLGSGDGSCALASGTNWPSGSGGNFLVVIDRGQNTEELAWASGTSGLTLTFSQRGAQGTSAVSHAAGCPIALSFGQQDLDEANQVVNQVLGQSGAAKGDILYMLSAAGPNTLKNLAVGSNGAVLAAAAGIPAWSAAGTSGQLLQSGGSGVPTWVNAPALPYGVMIQTSGTSVATGTDTLMTNMSASTGDGTTANGMSFASNAFTIPTGQGGLYQINAMVDFVTTATAQGLLYISYKRNAAFVRGPAVPVPNGQGEYGGTASWAVVLTAGDTIGLGALQNVVAGGSTTSGGVNTKLSLVRIS